MIVFDLAGTIGAITIVAAYVAIQTDRMDPKSAAFSLLNAVGAALILVSLTQDFNLGAAVVEGFWLLVSGYGLARAWRRRTVQAPAGGDAG